MGWSMYRSFIILKGRYNIVVQASGDKHVVHVPYMTNMCHFTGTVFYPKMAYE